MNLYAKTFYAFSLTLFVLTQTAFSQDNAALAEADARGQALNFMALAEDRFSCELGEHSMREIGTSSDIRYLVRLITEGDECDDAMVYLVNLAARDDELLFRQLPEMSQETKESAVLIGQELVHEVNPDIDEEGSEGKD